LYHHTGNIEKNWTIVNGLRLHSLVSRNPLFEERTPVVFVHGLAVSNRYLIPAMSEISKSRQVFAPDLPGWGESAKPRHVFNIAELADTLALWMQAMKIERAVVIGQSFGCQVAAEFAVRHASMVERIILAAPTFDRRARSAFRHFWRLLIDAPNEPFSLVLLALRDFLKFGIRREIKTLKFALRDKIEDKLPQIRIPALVIRGELDTVVPELWAREVAGLFPDGRLVTIKGGTHGVNYQMPQEFAATVLEFLNDRIE
jgi:pimeloyl-ACP methyl ester carboxylesterase